MCKGELIKFYKHEMSQVQLLPWCDDARDMDDIYVSLEMEYRGSSKLERNEDLVTLKTTQDMPATRILVKGVAGSGKSTLLARLAYRWAQQSSDSTLTKFDLLFIIGLREVERDSSLIDAIFQQLLAHDTKVSKVDLGTYIETHSDRCITLFDGFDEYKHDKAKQWSGKQEGIDGILTFKLLRDCQVILSTCPYKHLGSHQSHYISVKLTGFSPENVKLYMAKFFGDDTDMVEGLSRRLEESEMLTSLSTIPVMLMLMCLLWEDEQKLPDTQSELYQKFAHYLWRRYCMKQDIEVDVEGDYGGEDFNNAIHELGCIALAGLCPEKNIAKEKILFSETDFSESVFLKGCAIGLLSKERLRSQLNRCSAVTFMHKSLHEFCAARYWANLLETNSAQFYATLMQIDSWDTFLSKIELLKFCCGLVHNMGALAIILHGLFMYKKKFSDVSRVVIGYYDYQKTHTNITPILTLLYESQMLYKSQIPPNSHSSNDAFKVHSDFGRFCKENISSQELKVLSCFNQALKSLFAGSKLNLYNNPPQTLPMFHNFVKSSYGLSSLKAVKSVEFDKIPVDSWDVINDTLECMPQVQKLCISTSHINCLQPVHFRQFCLKLIRLVRLNEIRLFQDYISFANAILTPENVASILDAIQSKIEKINLSNIHVAEAIGHISHIMTPHLQILELINAKLEEDHMKVLSDFLPKASNLEELDLSRNTVGMTIVPLAQQLQSCTRLSELRLRNTQLTDQGVIELAQRFVFLPNLTVLNIHGIDLGNTAAHAVFKHLHHLTKLYEFTFSAHVDNQCSALVKECVTAIEKKMPGTAKRIPDTGSLRDWSLLY